MMKKVRAYTEWFLHAQITNEEFSRASEEFVF